MAEAKELFASIRAGDAAAARDLLDTDPALANAKNEQGQSAVLAAVYNNRPEIRDILIARGAQIELYEAAAAGQLERVKQLVEKNSVPSASYSPDGFPVLALAAAFGHLPVARYLFEKGGQVNAAATNGTGYNALTGAVTGGHTEIVKWLLENGADPNYRYGPGYTPLLAAAANGHLEIVRTLLRHGANLFAKTNDGKSAVSIADERKQTAIAEFLRGQGAA